ncbi:Salicylate biosynthesis protein PchB [Labrenzia sp. THAF191b]|uniref:chorismate mutase n=1 Tax=unclassified Labrenzia TaxID=2648686 RepID=UPI0012689B7A|nr:MULTISPECIES: chorismate mutase [unclassified Labrenzia]QFS95853.1 Salicylate biosynthesis protein PchB [Labrenzia sp. THAF191b]QFT02168.1 Salicylate biosynthesis protein PchB [Labrenzia sp. THAF191a]QFT13709.1 Salicylate biosynthesis protein PchB [Labrenzia sp. THAF187b]
MTLVKQPADCVSKTDIRTAIDALDEELLQLFARRQGYVRRMADLKQHPDEAFDHQRIETMVAALKDRAEELGLEGEQAEAVWRTLIDWNVAFEKRTIAARLEALQDGPTKPGSDF